jgi:hypothetical protein
MALGPKHKSRTSGVAVSAGAESRQRAISARATDGHATSTTHQDTATARDRDGFMGDFYTVDNHGQDHGVHFVEITGASFRAEHTKKQSATRRSRRPTTLTNP